MTDYKPRIADHLLRLKLSAMGAVLVEGPKWCGKTTTCEQQARSVLYMADPDRRSDYLRLAELDISRLLEGLSPRLIDEWQDAPQFWDAIRFRVDHNRGIGQFILTGSAVPPDTAKISHTGTGRFARLRMRPMSLWESEESSGGMSLAALFDGTAPVSAAARPLSLDETAFLVCRGGWPQTVGRTGPEAFLAAREYVESLAENDISRADKLPRNPDRVRRLLRSCARLQGTQSNLAAMRRDMAANDLRSLDESTIASYVAALKKIFVLEDLPAWCPDLRSKGAIRSADTRCFVDPSLAAAALSAGPGDLLGDLRSFGFFFESLALRDLRVYLDALGGSVAKYHDKTGLECDAVLRLPDGRYALAEIKLGGESLVSEGIATLDKLSALIRDKDFRPPAFRMVVTSTGAFAYRDRDVFICPLSSLKP